MTIPALDEISIDAADELQKETEIIMN